MPECAAAITPDSKIGDLLERWPELEEVLLGISPHFKALKNPVLRRTIAKVATLRQVATVSGVALGVLVERLRAGAGLAPAGPARRPSARPGRTGARWRAPTTPARRSRRGSTPCPA
jgi:hypothetical protein